MAIRSLIALVAVVTLTQSASAGKVKVWNFNQPSHYDKAKLHHLVINNEGGISLARQLKPLTGIDATHVWDLIEDKEGNLFAATGEDGKIFKVAPNGTISLAYQAEEGQIFCLAADAEGVIYAGAGPKGQIIRLDAKGGTVLCDTGESYVWSLAYDDFTKSLYAGTGPKGRIYKVTPAGQASLFYTTKQEHVLCVATGADGTVYAGTDKNGVVYRINEKGKGYVLHQAAQSEVRAIKVTDQAIYVGTSSPTRRRGGSITTSQDSGRESAAVADKEAPARASIENEPRQKLAEAKTVSKSSTTETKGTPAAAPSTPSVGENSVYRIARDGTVREIFRDKVVVLSLLPRGERLLIGTGMDGQLFQVDETTSERSELARLDHGQILSLRKRKDGSIVLSAGDPGKLFSLQDKFVSKGTITSEVLDAKSISKWGALRWQAETPSGTNLTVAVRAGNCSDPDDTWSDWSNEQTDPDKAMIAAPTGRFLQYRVTMTSTDPKASPRLRGLSLRYATTNQAPEITKIDVPDLNSSNIDNPKKLRIKWTAQDANEDELTYAVLAKKEGWSSWVQLEDELDKTEFEWDTTTTPSGVYQIKIVASDRRDNSDVDALTGERISTPFVVCHDEPKVAVKVTKVVGDQALVEAEASSPLARLIGASFAVNGKKWTNVFPAEGLFDSKSATFKFKAEGLKPGNYVIVLRVKDAAGNTGSKDVVFQVPEQSKK